MAKPKTPAKTGGSKRGNGGNGSSDGERRPIRTNALAKPRRVEMQPADEDAAPAVGHGQGQRFLVAGVGASAGGLQALQEFFSNAPADAPVAYVVVTHQHPEHQSLLPDLLRRSTDLPVQEAHDSEVVHPGHVYISPPRGGLAISKGVLRLLPSAEQGPALHPIDFFFRSLAQDQRERSVGIVLSGTGSDGTLGLAAIKGEGGITMAEDLQSASYTGMPENAIQSGRVDFVLPATGLARQLVSYARGQPIESLDAADAAREEKKLLALLRARTGHDFTHYKKNTIRRRIERRMNLHRIRDLSTYLRFLQDNTAEIDAMHKELLIGVTSFFRDPEMFDALASMLQKLVASCPDDHPVRVWVPGCSTGEEAYSIAILLREAMERAKRRITVRLFATDVDLEAVDQARTGVYPASITADVSSERLQRFFVHEERSYRVIKDIRDMIVFAPQNLLSDPPFTRLDLLSCRNVLIYMDSELQDRLITLFHYALRPNGLLYLGSSESVGGRDELFAVVDKKAKLYVRKAGSTQPRLTPRQATIPATRRIEAPAGLSMRQVSLPSLAANLLLQMHVPPSVLVNERGECVYIHGSTGAYLEPAQGQPSFNVVQMARDGLKLDIEAILRQAATQHDRTPERVSRVKDGRNYTRVRLRAHRIEDPEPLRGLVLITFENAPESTVKEKKQAHARRGARGLQLEEELQSTKQNLETTIEQLQASNEELQSANEELSSMNEELQSANEELEISKEETQALNEELHTVNAELRGTVDDLSRTNDDMTNLLNSTEIATIFLDRSLRVRRFTMHATKVIHLIPTDVGRPLADIMPKLKYDRLVHDAEDVFRTLVPKEVELESKEGGWFLMRLLPYRTAHERIDGLVMTFVDVTKLREAAAVEQARAYAESVVQSVRQPLLVLDADRRVLLHNRAFREAFPSVEAAQGKLLHDLPTVRWNAPALRQIIDKVISKNTDVTEVPLQLDNDDNKKLAAQVSVARLDPSREQPHRILVTFTYLADAAAGGAAHA